MTEALRPSELFALRWRSFDNVDTLSTTGTVYKGKIRPFGKTDGSLTDVHLPPGLAEQLRLWKEETTTASPHGAVDPDAFIFPNSRGGFMDTGNYRNRVLNPLGERLGLPKLNFQVMRRTMATHAQSMGSVKDIQAHLRHANADTTANEYMQELPERVKKMVGSVYAMLTKTRESAKKLRRFATKCYKGFGRGGSKL
jgi:integrase